MKKTALCLAFAMLAATGVFAQKNDAVVLKTSLDSVNYAYGMTMASNLLKVMDNDMNFNIFLAGLRTMIVRSTPLISAEEANHIFGDYNNRIAQPRLEQRWKDDNQKFLEENKKRPGVVTTPSGLQYEILSRGTGTVSPTATDRVEVHYHGTMINGEVFDSSVKRGQPITFGLNQVIPGWTEGLQYMKEGDKFKFYIPYNLAYGERSRGSIIKGYSTLIFEVELIKINP